MIIYLEAWLFGPRLSWWWLFFSDNFVILLALRVQKPGTTLPVVCEMLNGRNLKVCQWASQISRTFVKLYQCTSVSITCCWVSVICYFQLMVSSWSSVAWRWDIGILSALSRSFNLIRIIRTCVVTFKYIPRPLGPYLATGDEIWIRVGYAFNSFIWLAEQTLIFVIPNKWHRSGKNGWLRPWKIWRVFFRDYSSYLIIIAY